MLEPRLAARLRRRPQRQLRGVRTAAAEGYAIWAPDVWRDDIQRVLIRKGPDGFA